MTDRSRPGLAVDCDEVVELVTDYLEGALPSELAAEVAAHLELCVSCDAYLAQMRRTIDELGRVPVDSLSDRAKADLMQTFRAYHSPGHPGQGSAPNL
jgi:anti-sigma factor RsiW